MRILLVAPASGLWHQVGRSRFFNGRTFRFSLLSLLSVAADVPPDVDVTIVDEQVDRLPTDEPWDLVGITCMTAAAPRAYEIAAQFRDMRIPVVLGGMHPTFLPQEALEHADAVCLGEAEGLLPSILDDARAGRLHGAYRRDSPAAMDALKPVPRHLLRGRSYFTLQAVQATRGCPHRCSFCSVSAFHGGRHRHRPVSAVIAEVAALPQRFFMFVDDSLAADRDYARELFRALVPLQRKWVSQCTFAIADDAEMVRLAAEAGCAGFFVGLESFSGASLATVGKTFNRVSEYRERIRFLHAGGITVEAGIMFGFDTDGPEVFRETLECLDAMEVDMIQASILTPLPGTPQFDAMQARIFDRDWSHYDFHHAVFEPAGMTAAQLQAGHDWLAREFYLPSRIARRLARMARRPRGLPNMAGAATLNLAYYGRSRRFGWAGCDPTAPS